VVIREANLPSLSLPHSHHPDMMTLGYRYLYRRADRVLATSRRMADELSGLGVAFGKLAILSNPVPVTALRLRAITPCRLPGDGLRLVVAGRLTEQKGFDRLLPLLSGMADLRLLILGEGPLRDSLEDLARQHGVAVEMPGFVDNAPAWFAGADAVLLPSRWEGMPNTALEALACGTPVIATPEAGGIAEVAAATPAVRVVPMGDGFAAAIQAIVPRGESTLRPSVLPAIYDADTVGRQFADYLENVS
jgi:glycosyltransferase involved in cell wall biosynthesis